MAADQADGIEKSAILLVTLGEAYAAEVLKNLGPKEVQQIAHAMSALKTIPREKVQNVLKEYIKNTQERSNLHVDTDNYIRSVLNKALGEDRASNLISRITQGEDNSSIESLKWLDASTVADLIKNEHPQIIATILVYLEHSHASDILNKFTERLRNDVVLRIATLEGIQPEALRELNAAMARMLSNATSLKKTPAGGVKKVAEILNFTESGIQTTVIGNIRDYDGDLAQKIMDEMFVFEDIINIDDRSIQIILRDVQTDSLVLALKGASEEIRAKIFKNMSQRASEMLKEDLESKGPVRLSEVENEQKEILKTIRRLADEGQIVIGGAGGEAMV